MQRSVAQSRLAAVCEKMGEAIDSLNDEECVFLTRTIGRSLLRSARAPPPPDFSKMTLRELLESVGNAGEDEEEEEEEAEKKSASRKRSKGGDEEAAAGAVSESLSQPAAAVAVEPQKEGDVPPYDWVKHAVIDKVVCTNADGIVVAARKSTHNRAAVNHALVTSATLDKLKDSWRLFSSFFANNPMPEAFMGGEFEKWHRWNKHRK